MSSRSQAKEEMLAYVQFTINAYDSGKVDTPRTGTKEGVLVAHWDSVFTYVGYPAPNLPVSVLGSEGAVGVITQTTVNRELAAAHAAITVPVQDTIPGDERGHLFSIYPIPGGCLTGTNLAQNGPCFDFEANPIADPKFSPKAKLGVCQPVDVGDAIPGNVPALGHLEDDGNTTVTEPTSIYQTDTFFCPHDNDIGSWTGGFGGIGTRLAWLTGRAFGLQTAYAANGGLGGLDDDLSSPFGSVDLLVFKATFTSDVVDSTPTTPEVGSWDTPLITHPGSIEVQDTLGNLTTKPVVLSQAGGNCGPACGGLLFEGRLASEGPLATTGRYHVEWYSVQDGPTLSTTGAPFILRGSAGEIARVTYSKASSTNILSFNGTPFGTWTRHEPDHFEIVVDLDANTTSLTVNGSPVAAGTFGAALDFASIAADFRGIDSGIMGWDDIKVTRLFDQ